MSTSLHTLPHLCTTPPMSFMFANVSQSRVSPRRCHLGGQLADGLHEQLCHDSSQSERSERSRISSKERSSARKNSRRRMRRGNVNDSRSCPSSHTVSLILPCRRVALIAVLRSPESYSASRLWRTSGSQARQSHSTPPV